MKKLPVYLGGVFATLLISATAHAACDVDKPGYELSGGEAESVYDCLKADLQAGYQEGPKRWISEDFVKDYPGWTKASAFPAAPGFHGGRFLVTYVNAIGADEYLKYKPEDVQVPAGTKIAKESFAIDDDGKVSKGPLFLMEKVSAGTSPETGDWYYMMVAPTGAPQAVNVMTACSECHLENFGEQGGLGYPVEDARIR
ncbi:cytochrome P460 family protein [uncultured Roseibium sp.]|uniref:cytochrome P460 family protein n=1 Tax=uncultured Roseibium sp. TaxID=1936171 RepID=UPI0026265BDD|nr:cytochrome P460 family protein [uncultured Roseibium sp.]